MNVKNFLLPWKYDKFLTAHGRYCRRFIHDDGFMPISVMRNQISASKLWFWKFRLDHSEIEFKTAKEAMADCDKMLVRRGFIFIKSKALVML